MLIKKIWFAGFPKRFNSCSELEKFDFNIEYIK